MEVAAISSSFTSIPAGDGGREPDREPCGPGAGERPEPGDPELDCVGESSLEWFPAPGPERGARLGVITAAIPWRSPGYRSALDRVRRFSRSRLPILITGESGSGKTAFAEAAHAWGPNSAEPFVAVNCASLPEGLLESELFGHVRGAFTGAETGKAGLLLAAGAGTVFLDEIDKASRAFQAALLHILDRREVRPVGGTSTRAVHARLAFATNRDLGSLGDAFLADLAFRIGGMTVFVPPLRERLQDLDLLLALALRELRLVEGIGGARIHRTARNLLSTYDWPGNVRELFGIVHAAAHLAGPDRLVGVREVELAAQASLLGAHARRASRDSDLATRIREFEREEVLLAIRLEGGHQSRAARRLGLSRRGLNKKLHRLGLLDQLDREGLRSFRRRPPEAPPGPGRRPAAEAGESPGNRP